MKITRRFALALSAAVLAFGVGSAAAADKLIIGTEGAYPPFNNVTADGKVEVLTSTSPMRSVPR